MALSTCLNAAWRSGTLYISITRVRLSSIAAGSMVFLTLQ